MLRNTDGCIGGYAYGGHLQSTCNTFPSLLDETERDLEAPGLDSVYNATWNSVTPQKTDNIFANRLEKEPDYYACMC